jgi:hypothetical protein
MRLFRRFRQAVLTIAASTVVAAMCGLPAPDAYAFFSQNHERIVREALPPDVVDQTAMVQILVGPPPGAGAVGTDVFFFDEFRHIDNAMNPADICARGQQAWNTFLPVILSGSQPAGTELANGPSARAAFGALAHAVEDFYSHSDWAERNVTAGQPERLAPPIFPTCDPAAFPADLQTGFFQLGLGAFGENSFLDDPLSGCPPGGPPPGFRDCLSAVNKDGPSTPRGSQPVPGTNMNMYDLAALLATRATTDLFWQVRGLVASNAGECAARNLFQADRHEPC